MSQLELTPQEKAELEARPIGDSKWRDLTEEQLAIRVEIGKKIHARFMKDDDNISARCRAIYEKMPMWGFYEDANSASGWPPRRSYGVCIGEEDEERLYTATLMPMFNNRTIGGTPTSSLRRVDRWSPEIIERMKTEHHMYQHVGLWEDPLGFWAILMEAAE